MNCMDLYKSKKASLEECLNLIRSNDRVCFAGDCNEPDEFAKQLHTIAPRVENVSVIKSRYGNYDFVHNPGMNGHINTGGFFYGPGWAEGHKNLNCSLIVTDLPDYAGFVADYNPCNVFVASVAPMDDEGNFRLSLCMMWEQETFESVMKQPDARIILEVNKQQVRVKGGLTGYAQIYGKYNTSAYDKLRLDLLYIENQSIWMDLKMILLTIKVLFIPESTEGFSEEKSRRMHKRTGKAEAQLRDE